MAESIIQKVTYLILNKSELSIISGMPTNDEKQIDSIKDIRQSDRYVKLLTESKSKLKEEEDKANNELNNAKIKLDQFETELSATAKIQVAVESLAALRNYSNANLMSNYGVGLVIE